ncbi:hypothetical protein EX30DRAFT_195774 [Ascodesmis nigricans]|uniref:Uncharacterized protein n=1 Tax=Ascodesmis nigricans TaxID=341454 RepID=A0A4S2MRF8_9PEZI|nr:hypothetical protein EX30DRAFT_195774 [Ascodesmis nigricans]
MCVWAALPDNSDGREDDDDDEDDDSRDHGKGGSSLLPAPWNQNLMRVAYSLQHLRDLYRRVNCTSHPHNHAHDPTNPLSRPYRISSTILFDHYSGRNGHRVSDGPSSAVDADYWSLKPTATFRLTLDRLGLPCQHFGHDCVRSGAETTGATTGFRRGSAGRRC